jgi:serine/threonine protein kinase
MAPEMLLDLGYDEKADVYSFGIVLSELYTQDEPYKGIFRSFEGTFPV